MQDELEEKRAPLSSKQALTLGCDVPWQESTTSAQRGRVYTEVDEEGRSWAVIEDFDRATMSEWIGGIPDTWKRR